MKKHNLTGLFLLCCLSLCFNPKTEKKLPTIYYNNDQNYKFDDDDERLKKNIEESLKKAQPIQEKLKKRSII